MASLRNTPHHLRDVGQRAPAPPDAFTAPSITPLASRDALRSDAEPGNRPLRTRHHGRPGIVPAAARPRRGCCRRQPSFRCRRRWRRTRHGDPSRSAAGCRARRSRHRGVRSPWRGVGWMSPRPSRVRLGRIGPYCNLHGPYPRGLRSRYNVRKHETYLDEPRGGPPVAPARAIDGGMPSAVVLDRIDAEFWIVGE